MFCFVFFVFSDFYGILQFGPLWEIQKTSRNKTAEKLFGYSAAEALGRDAVELLVDPRDFSVANNIIERVSLGERWTGQFPVKNKSGERFVIVATNTPFYDDDGSLIGIICVSSDSRSFREMGIVQTDTRPLENSSRPRNTMTTKFGLDPEQPLQSAIASKITNLVSVGFFIFL